MRTRASRSRASASPFRSQASRRPASSTCSPIWVTSTIQTRASPLEKGYITSSSPPIVVNGVVVVGNSAEQGYNQSRIENIPGDILAYDARTGKFLWKFNVLPKPGEFGHETWENDAWKWTGDISSWAPLAADDERGIVYIPTNGATVDFYGGFRPGNNLFSTSLLALDVKTGKRLWHFQMVHHDIWNYDTPTAPVLLDVQHNGKPVPAVVQVTKQAFAYAFNRVTGEPLWPIIEKQVAASKVPGEKMAKTQPFPTKPAPYDMQGLTIDDLIDYTPELREKAVDAVPKYEIGPLFLPPLHRDNDLGKKGAALVSRRCRRGQHRRTRCSRSSHRHSVRHVSKGCSSRILAPGNERDALEPAPTGTTIAAIRRARRRKACVEPDDLPLYKPPYSRITAIDMNTGEHLWWIPVGETPNRVKNHPKLKGIDVGDTGTGRVATMTVTDTLLIYQGETSDGTPHLFAIDKKTGKQLGKVKVDGSDELRNDDLHAQRQSVRRAADRSETDGGGAAQGLGKHGLSARLNRICASALGDGVPRRVRQATSRRATALSRPPRPSAGSSSIWSSA